MKIFRRNISEKVTDSNILFKQFTISVAKNMLAFIRSIHPPVNWCKYSPFFVVHFHCGGIIYPAILQRETVQVWLYLCESHKLAYIRIGNIILPGTQSCQQPNRYQDKRQQRYFYEYVHISKATAEQGPKHTQEKVVQNHDPDNNIFENH